MQVKSPLPVSRAYLFLLGEYLATDEVTVEIDRNVLDRVISSSSSMNASDRVPPGILKKASALGDHHQGQVPSKEFANALGLEEDGDPAASTSWEVLGAVQALFKMGAIKFKERQSSGGRVQKQRLFTGLDAVMKETFKDVEGFLQQATSIASKKCLGRYRAVQQFVLDAAGEYHEFLSNERLYWQQSVKFPPVLPIRNSINEAFNLLDRYEQRLASLKNQIDNVQNTNVSIPVEAIYNILALIDPVIDITKDPFESIKTTTSTPRVFPAIGTGEAITFSTAAARIPETPGAAISNRDGLLFAVESGLLTITDREISKKEQKETRQGLTSIIKDGLVNFINHAWPEHARNEAGKLGKDERLSAILPKVLKGALQAEEQGLMQMLPGKGIDATRPELQARVKEYRDAVDATKEWSQTFLDVLKTIAVPYSSAIDTLVESISYQDQEISRFSSKMEFFLQENKNQEEKVYIRDEIRQILKEIDEVVSRHESNIGAILNKPALDFELLHQSLARFKQEHENALTKLNDTLQRYDAFKLLNIIGEIKQFLEKRDAKIRLVNNMALVDLRSNLEKIVSLITGIDESLHSNDLLSIERGSLVDDRFQEHVDEIIGRLESTEGTFSQVEDEFVIKKTLSHIEDRLEELNVIKKQLEEKKDKILLRLLKDDERDKFLEAHKVGECIICYDPITTLDDEVIVCPHCGRFGHYLCLAYWLEKYRLCPVCHGKLVTPSIEDDQASDSEFLDE